MENPCVIDELDDAYETQELIPHIRCNYIEPPTDNNEANDLTLATDLVLHPLDLPADHVACTTSPATARLMQQALAMSILPYSQIRVQVDGGANR